MTNTRTATVSSGFVETFATTLKTLLANTQAGKGEEYVDVLIENQGSAELLVASMTKEFRGTPVQGDFAVLSAGDILPLERIALSKTFVATADDAITNQLRFTGTPDPGNR